ncbi:DUF4013 domain-containing protein [Methanobacterium aggregans]|uniref:DUF4013 domain-containing protein n=1 Tax=Methanobacterium aggregans TaxID=1615586 RepID=UPI001AEA58A9|nr:DUF4013 domain-containing protein [Methanobacterium aggregans]MBP2046308.1 hypothetical protein [Methanobacterium aggregans]
MEIGELVSDALRYPLSDWQKLLILGVVVILSSISELARMLGTTNSAVIIVLGIIGLIFSILVSGYMIRIIKASLANIAEIPAMEDWKEMFIDGIKADVVGIIYAIPAILIIIISIALAALTLLGSTSLSDPAALLGLAAGAGIGGIIALLYMLIITPIIAIAITNMAYQDEFKAAFRFSEIMAKISEIGWGNLIIWYIVMIVLFIILSIIGGIITGIFSIITPILGTLIFDLVVMPYIYMFLSRSVALEYAG